MAYNDCILVGLLLCTLATINGVIGVETEMDSSCVCGSAKKILDGNGKETGQYPFVAALIEKYASNRIYCFGAIISNFYALTTAYCATVIKREDLTSSIGLMVAEHNKSKDAETNTARITYEIKHFIIHEQFDKTIYGSDHDIALINTEKEIQYSALVGPVCLPHKYKNEKKTFLGETVEVTGRSTKYFIENSNLHLTVLPNDKCSENVTADQICASLPSTHTARVHVQSGSPLIWHENNDRYVLIGIAIPEVQFGLKPGAFTRITSYMDWILEHIKNHPNC